MTISVAKSDYSAERKTFGHLRLGLEWRTRLAAERLPDNADVLDIGAAEGAMMFELARRRTVKSWKGLEQSPERVAVMGEHGVVGSAVELPFSDGSFDAVLSSATRKHIKDSARMMREIARVLRPNGKVIIIDPHPWLLRVGVAIGKFDPRWLHHFDFASAIATEMQAAGITPIETRNRLFTVCVGRR